MFDWCPANRGITVQILHLPFNLNDHVVSSFSYEIFALIVVHFKYFCSIDFHYVIPILESFVISDRVEDNLQKGHNLRHKNVANLAKIYLFDDQDFSPINPTSNSYPPRGTWRFRDVKLHHFFRHFYKF